MKKGLTLASAIFAIFFTAIINVNPLLTFAQAESTNAIVNKMSTSGAIYNPSANGDTLTDIIAFNPITKQINVTLSTGVNFGDGNASSQVWNTSSGYSTKDWNLLKPADVDGDGDADIIAFNKNTTQIDVSLSDTKNFGGGYKGYQIWNSKSGYSSRSWILLDPADVNGDKKADIIAFNPITKQIDVTLSTGRNFGGGYKGYKIWNSNSGYHPGDWELLSPADVNGDGMADLIARHVRGEKVDVTLSTGKNFGGGYRGYKVWCTNTGLLINYWNMLDLADITGDKRADLITWDFNNGFIRIIPSTGEKFNNGFDEHFNSEIITIRNEDLVYTNRANNPWHFLTPSDVNGDNYADIIILDKRTGKVTVYPTVKGNFGFWYPNKEIWNSDTGYKNDWQILN